jgi:hypothetical protein
VERPLKQKPAKKCTAMTLCIPHIKVLKEKKTCQFLSYTRATIITQLSYSLIGTEHKLQGIIHIPVATVNVMYDPRAA